MNYFQLYLAGVFRPARAFDEIRTRPAPLWAFKVLLFFNLVISATSTLARILEYAHQVPPIYLPTHDAKSGQRLAARQTVC
jgi:hypothetical protein